MSKRLPNVTLKLCSKTWDKDTNGLFDYSTKTIKKATEVIQASTCLIRKNHEIKSAPNETFEQNEEKLIKIEKKENSNIYYFDNKVEKNMEANAENIAKINNNCWYICNDNQNNFIEQNKVKKNYKNKNDDYYLLKNDIIKFGRVKFALTDVHLWSGDKRYDLQLPDKASTINRNNLNTENVFDLEKEVQYLEEVNSEEKILCRICYCEEEDKERNPMVHLCKCKGGINYAHFNCIKLWMRTKLIIIGNRKRTVKTYYINKFNCEICKTPYPFHFKIPNHDKIFELIDIKRPDGNYIILESLDQVKDNNNNKYIHIISLVNEEEITIGRGIDADMKINDISVSRLHSKLKFNFEQKSLLIKDCGSKFGTLVLIKNPFELREKEFLEMQVGRSVVSAKVIKGDRKKIFGFKKVNDKKEKEELTQEMNIMENDCENIHKIKIMFLSENESEKHLEINEGNYSMDIVV